MPLPPDTAAAAADDAADPARRLPAAADLVRQMLRQHPFKGRRIVAALPRDVVHTKNLRLPPMPPEELPAVVRFEARNVFPFPTDQARVHHLAAGEVRQGTEVRQEVILMAARNDDVNAVVEHLHRAGAVLESLDVEPCALYRSVERFIRRKEDENDVNVLVDVGVARSQVVIGRGHDISFIKPIDIGGQHFHEAVARKLGITPDEARALRRRLVESGEPAAAATAAPGLSRVEDRRDPVRQAVFDATRAPMEELGREIALCLRYYSVTFRGHRPTRLRLLGGEACDPQLQTLLNSALVIPVEVGRPLYSIDTSRMKPADRQGPMCEWALALGLALRMTRDYYGPRDGKPRDPFAPATDAVADPAAIATHTPATPAAGGAEIVDLTTALRQADAVASEHEAIAAADAPSPPISTGTALMTALAGAPAVTDRTRRPHPAAAGRKEPTRA
jgi:type IV pilus assembly protein PilM